MASWNSNNYDGRYLSLYISEAVDTINNTSTLYWTLTSAGGSVNYYTIGATTVTINGTQVYYKEQTSWNAKVFPAAKSSVSGAITVAHNSGGDKTIYVGFSTRVYYSAPEDYGGNMTLSGIDRTAPTINISTSEVRAYGVTLSASASTTCDIWDYTTDNWTTYHQYSTSAAVSNSVNITGLSPNATYLIAVRARKQSNNVVGWSGINQITTLGNAVLNSVSTLTADAEIATLFLNWTVYSTEFTYLLDISIGSTVITTITIPPQSSTGTANKAITLTAAQRFAVLSAMSSVKSFIGTFSLLTHRGADTIGSVSSKDATITTTATNSAPTFNNLEGFTYQDSNTTTAAVTGNNQIIVQSYSTLQAIAYAATAKNGATTSQYEATINGVTVTSPSTTLNCGTVAKSGNLILTVKVVDSRGYSVSVSKTITVAAYAKADITAVTMRRVNEVEALTQVTLAAQVSKLLVSSVDKNAFQRLMYRYKKTSDSSYGSWTIISASTVTVSGTNVSFTSNDFLSLDADYSYNIQFYTNDKLTSDTFIVTLAQGMPLVSKRRKKVGINNRNPTCALDVAGEVKQNGVYVLGFVGNIDGDFNNYKNGGIYLYSANPVASNAPTSAGLIEVITNDESYVIQRFTAFSEGCAMYVRSFGNNSWTSWTQK